MDNEQVGILLEEIFTLWTNIFEDENGNELSLPASQEEADKSRKILTKISTLDFDDELLQQRFKQLDEIISEYEAKLVYQKTPDGQADKLLDEMYSIWSNKWYEDGSQYGSPANDSEVDQSWELARRIEEIDITNVEVAERFESYKGVLEAYKESLGEQTEDEYNEAGDSPENKDNQLAYEKLDQVYNSWGSVSYEDDEEYRSPKNNRQVRKSRSRLKKIASMSVTDAGVKNRIDELKDVLDSYEDAIPGYSLKIIFFTCTELKYYWRFLLPVQYKRSSSGY